MYGVSNECPLRTALDVNSVSFSVFTSFPILEYRLRDRKLHTVPRIRFRNAISCIELVEHVTVLLLVGFSLNIISNFPVDV